MQYQKAGRVAQLCSVRTPRTPPHCVRSPSRARAVCIRCPAPPPRRGDTVTFRCRVLNGHWERIVDARRRDRLLPPPLPLPLRGGRLLLGAGGGDVTMGSTQSSSISTSPPASTKPSSPSSSGYATAPLHAVR